MRMLHPIRTLFAAALLVLALVVPGQPATAAPTYPWRGDAAEVADTLATRIAPPDGFERVAAEPGGFAEWLRGLPVKPAGSMVMLYNGLPKVWAAPPAAVIDIDVGKQDLQQCADAIMRLRAEYLFSLGRTGDIGFDYTNGGRVDFKRWSQGMRPVPKKKGVAWSRKGKADASYASFRRYMDQIFSYAGTYSLSRELAEVPVAELRIGDLFIKGGFPGHAMLVADMAENKTTGEKRFLLLQSFMPAQDMHIVLDPRVGRHLALVSGGFRRQARDAGVDVRGGSVEAVEVSRWSLKAFVVLLHPRLLGLVPNDPTTTTAPAPPARAASPRAIRQCPSCRRPNRAAHPRPPDTASLGRRAGARGAPE